jgi:hypothetical protein
MLDITGAGLLMWGVTLGFGSPFSASQSLFSARWNMLVPALH